MLEEGAFPAGAGGVGDVAGRCVARCSTWEEPTDVDACLAEAGVLFPPDGGTGWELADTGGRCEERSSVFWRAFGVCGAVPGTVVALGAADCSCCAVGAFPVSCGEDAEECTVDRCVDRCST